MVAMTSVLAASDNYINMKVVDILVPVYIQSFASERIIEITINVKVNRQLCY